MYNNEFNMYRTAFFFCSINRHTIIKIETNTRRSSVFHTFVYNKKQHPSQEVANHP